MLAQASLVAQLVKESACNVGVLGSIPGLGRSHGEGDGNPLQYSCLENPRDRGAWQATVHGVTRVGHDLATKPTNQPRPFFKNKIIDLAKENHMVLKESRPISLTFVFHTWISVCFSSLISLSTCVYIGLLIIPNVPLPFSPV